MISVRLSIPKKCPEGAQWLPLSKNMFALIDKDDFERVSPWLWSVLVRREPYTPYAMRREMYRTIYLHRFIMDAPQGMDVDHINGDGLDCRKLNLRICTHAQNQYNYTKCASKTSSKFKGVSFDPERNLWNSKIKKGKHDIYLGRFNTEEEAAHKYDDAARLHFGEFARLNFPRKDKNSRIRFLFKQGIAWA